MHLVLLFLCLFGPGCVLPVASWAFPLVEASRVGWLGGDATSWLGCAGCVGLHGVRVVFLFPGPGIESVSPASARGFFTARPQGGHVFHRLSLKVRVPGGFCLGIAFRLFFFFWLLCSLWDLSFPDQGSNLCPTMRWKLRVRTPGPPGTCHGLGISDCVQRVVITS